MEARPAGVWRRREAGSGRAPKVAEKTAAAAGPEERWRRCSFWKVTPAQTRRYPGLNRGGPCTRSRPPGRPAPSSAFRGSAWCPGPFLAPSPGAPTTRRRRALSHREPGRAWSSSRRRWEGQLLAEAILACMAGFPRKREEY
ncbi:unnamed protein product [Nyctereutes procyonoides]|uniref:(raccoon dog) hypothetical protein n=1 Tax=Nyctereutes procyonoides TaxID=34880 RepID=A0A811XXQ1_NYCPR|nr:unnamed protein product [Nyctereutes procyonoides]